LRPPNAGTGGSGLQQQLVMERRFRNRRLIRQIGEDEGRLVLRERVSTQRGRLVETNTEQESPEPVATSGDTLTNCIEVVTIRSSPVV
jgi:hypothetical protein